MKRIKNFALAITGISMALAMTCCKTAAPKEETKSAADVCVNENKISVTIQNYKYGMKDTLYEFIEPDFKVVQSKWNYINDSTAELKLSNYKVEELTGERQANQVDILIKLNSKKGQLLQAGSYPYHKYDGSLYCSVNLITSSGTVWFNWFMGMPEQGDVVVDYIDKDNVCGSFNMNVEQPDNKTIGVVRLNGTFKVTK